MPPGAFLEVVFTDSPGSSTHNRVLLDAAGNAMWNAGGAFRNAQRIKTALGANRGEMNEKNLGDPEGGWVTT